MVRRLTYPFKTKPFKHQLEEWEAHYDDLSRGIFWDQGVGKTKLIIDSVGRLYDEGKLRGLLVLAPNGVHRNWVENELPKHLPDHITANMRTHIFHNNKLATLWHGESVEALMNHPGFCVLVMSYEGIMSEDRWVKLTLGRRRVTGGRSTAKRFLESRPCMYVLDESSMIKAPNAKRTKRILGSKNYGKYKRVLNGTPVTNSPFDVYSQLRFLDENVWRQFGISNFAAFRTYFGEYVTEEIYVAGGKKRQIQVLTKYRHLDKLQQVMKRMGTRVLKEDVLDLPPKLYSKRYFELSPQQKKAYAELRDEYMTVVEGELITTPLAITRLLRLQQVVCGFIGAEDGSVLGLMDGPNPRLKCLTETLSTTPNKVIVFSKFKQAITQIMDACGAQAVRYDGDVDNDQRANNLRRFQDVPLEEGGARIIVANPAVAAMGLDMFAARTVIYYDNSFKLHHRLQSEDRAHRHGQRFPVDYIDILAAGTVDVRIVNSLRGHYDISTQVTGDTLREWL